MNNIKGKVQTAKRGMTVAGAFIGFWLLAVGFPTSALAVGECGAQFLKIGVGARACAMGEAFTAVADDASAIYWNPAGLRKLEGIELLAMQNFWLLDMSYQYVAAALPTPLGALGLAGAYSSSGKIPRYEEFRKVGEYSAYDLAASLAYAGRAGPLGFGAGAKFIQQRIDTSSASGYAVDAGLLYRFGLLSAGLAVQNIGPGIRFIEKTDPLPLTVKAGAAARVGPVVVAGDISKPRDNDFRFGLGVEGVILDILALRAGYNTANSFSAGGGVTWQAVSVDYAFVPYRRITATHRISVRLRF